jgi:hypothetical protein
LHQRDLQRELKSKDDTGIKLVNSGAGGVAFGAGSGAAAGAAIGATLGGGVFSIPAAAIGAAIGLVAGVVTGAVTDVASMSEEKALDAIAEKAKEDKDFKAKLDSGKLTENDLKIAGISLDDEKLRKSLLENQKGISDLIKELEANTAAIDSQNDLAASQILSDNNNVIYSNYRDEIVDVAGDAYGIAYDKAMKDLDGWGTENISKATTRRNKEAQKVFEEYLEAAGIADQGYELSGVTGTDKNRKFVYTDKEGNETPVSLEAMRAAMAA